MTEYIDYPVTNTFGIPAKAARFVEYADVDDGAGGYRWVLLGVFSNRLRAVSTGSNGRHCGALCARAHRRGALYGICP